MADAYPWGAQAPTQRVSKLNAQLAASERKREETITAHRARLADLDKAHKARIAELDEADRQTKADLRVASAIVDRERQEAAMAAAAKMFDRILSGGTINVEEAINTGVLERVLRDAVESAAKGDAPTPKASRKSKAEPAPAEAGGRADVQGASAGDGEQA